MNAKTRNKIATAGIYTLVSIVVIILFGILGDILVSGVPHLSWHFLSSESSSYQAGGGVRDQLFNFVSLDTDYFFANCIRSWDLFSRIC